MQARSGFYKTYAERMASWGYLVIQYNLPLFWIIPDANEVWCDTPRASCSAAVTLQVLQAHPFSGTQELVIVTSMKECC